MFSCPVCCERKDFENILGLRRHITKHVSDGFRFRYPLQCSQTSCGRSYETLDSFMVHVESKHANDFVVTNPANNENVSLDFPFIDSPGNVIGNNLENNRPFNAERGNAIQSYDEKVLTLLLQFYSNSSVVSSHSFVDDVLKSFLDFLSLLRPPTCRRLFQSHAQISCLLNNTFH